MGYSPMAGTAHSTTGSRLCLNKRGTQSHLLEAQSFSNLAGQLESTSPSERNSYHGHPWLGSSVVSRGHVDGMPVSPGVYIPIMTYWKGQGPPSATMPH